MSDLATFTEFIRRIRDGDEHAAEELVRRFEPLIRREVRLRLEDRRLSRLFESLDVCQSVLKSFFFRAAAGQYDLDTPEQLQGLLVTMARNKLAEEARRQRRHCRDNRRLAADGAEQLAGVAGAEPSPSEVVAGKEMLQRFRQALTDEERVIAELRSQGASWAEVVARLGGTEQARRMQLTRAVERVGRELGLDEEA